MVRSLQAWADFSLGELEHSQPTEALSRIIKLELPSIGVHASPPQSPTAAHTNGASVASPPAGATAAEVRNPVGASSEVFGKKRGGVRPAAKNPVMPSSSGDAGSPTLSLAPSVVYPIRRTHVRDGSASADEPVNERPLHEEHATASGLRVLAHGVSDAVLTSVSETLRLVVREELSEEWISQFKVHARR